MEEHLITRALTKDCRTRLTKEANWCGDGCMRYYMEEHLITRALYIESPVNNSKLIPSIEYEKHKKDWNLLSSIINRITRVLHINTSPVH